MIHPTMQNEFNEETYFQINLAIAKIENQLGVDNIVDVKRKHVFDIENNAVYLILNNQCVNLRRIPENKLHRDDLSAVKQLDHYIINGKIIHDGLRRTIAKRDMHINSLQMQLRNYGIIKDQKDFNVELKVIEKLRASAVYYQIKALSPNDFLGIEKLFRRQFKPEVELLVSNIWELLALKMTDELKPTDQYVNFKPVIDLVTHTACWFIGDAGKKGYYVEHNKLKAMEIYSQKAVDNLVVTDELTDNELYHRVIYCLLAISFMLTLDYMDCYSFEKKGILMSLTKLIEKLSSLYFFDEKLDEHLGLLRNKFN